MRAWILLSACLAACVPAREPEAFDDWFGPMGDLDEDVTEPVAFTTEDYALPAGDGDVASLDPLFEDFTRNYAPGDTPPDGDCDGWQTDNDLPMEFWATVTLLPRYYFKTDGCDTQADAGDSEEKYYGSFFIEDETGGVFVLGDSKVAHVDMGDRVKIRVRGVARAFGLDMVVAHDIVEVERGPFPIHFEMAEPLDAAGEYPPEAVGSVRRVEGVVQTAPDTFGEFSVLADDGTRYLVALDAELNRRNVGFAPGRRIRATGPLQRAFGDKIVIMRVGQLEALD